LATITAQILVGSGHPNHDGIVPSHNLYFMEDNRPSWTLYPVSLGDGFGTKVTWIPTLEHTLEDALLMTAIHVVRDPEIEQMAKEFISSQENNWVVMYDDVDPGHLELMYQRCRAMTNSYKLVLTVLRGSAIEEQLPVLKEYKMDLEVCLPRYVRLYSRWLEQTRVEGEL